VNPTYIEIDPTTSPQLISYLNQDTMTTFWFLSAIICLLLLQIMMVAVDHRKQD
jgi:hypothetical protein